MRRPITCLAVLGLALAGCGGPGSVVHSYKDGDVTTAKEVTRFAQGSAAEMFAAAYRPVYVFGRGPATSDCPKVTDDGRTLVVAGDGCTGLANSTWLGRMTFVRSGGSLVVDKAGPGPPLPRASCSAPSPSTGSARSTESPCFVASSPLELYTPKTTGSAPFSADGDSKARFTVDLVTDGTGRPSSCPPAPLATAAEYKGSVTAVRDGRVAFTGSGTFGSPTDGKVSARTDAEVIDEMTGCSTWGRPAPRP